MTYPSPFYGAPPPRRSRIKPIMIGVLALLVLLCAGLGVALAADGGSDQGAAGVVTVETTPDPSFTTPAAATSPTPKAVAELSWSDGTFAVGSDIAAGTYVTRGSDNGCYWARLKNFDGDLDSIIANHLLDAHARGRMVVKKTDKGVELTGGCVWTRVPS